MTSQEQTNLSPKVLPEASKPKAVPNRYRLRGQQIKNELYGILIALNPRIWFWTRFVGGLLPAYSAGSVRAILYRKAGCRIAQSVTVLGRLHLIGNGKGNYAARLIVGEGSIIAPDVRLGLEAEIHIGQNVSISPGVVLHTATHSIGFGSRRMNLTPQAKSVVVEDGVWIGMHSLILPGVRLGRGCVVAAGAVVTQDVPENSLVSGNPAVVQQTLPFGNR